MLKIFAAVGNDNHDFSRLILLLNSIALIDPSLRIKVQNGYSKRIGDNLEFLEFLTHDEMNFNINDSDVIISHAGAGIVTQAHNFGKFPILIPRLVCLNEHTDPSQPEFGAHMEALGLAKFHLTPTPYNLYHDLFFAKNKKIISSGNSSLENTLGSLLEKYRNNKLNIK